MKKFFICLISFLPALSGVAQKEISISPGKPFAKVSPQMWGIFFEDINFAADGGLFAELIKKWVIRISYANDGMERN